VTESFLFRLASSERELRLNFLIA